MSGRALRFSRELKQVEKHPQIGLFVRARKNGSKYAVSSLVGVRWIPRGLEILSLLIYFVYKPSVAVRPPFGRPAGTAVGLILIWVESEPGLQRLWILLSGLGLILPPANSACVWKSLSASSERS